MIYLLKKKSKWLLNFHPDYSGEENLKYNMLNAK